MYKRKSTIFENVHLHDDLQESDVFSVYYDEEDETIRKATSTKKLDLFTSSKKSLSSIRLKFGALSAAGSRRISIRDINVLRGFNQNLVNEQLSVAHGSVDLPKTPKGINFTYITACVADKLALLTKRFNHLPDTEEIGTVTNSGDSVSDSVSSNFTTNDHFSELFSHLRFAKYKNLEFKLHRQTSGLSAGSSGSDNAGMKMVC